MAKRHKPSTASRILFGGGRRLKAPGSDPDRLAWIRQQPCAIRGLHECDGPIDAHHRTGAGMALKNPDDQAFPLCRRAHRNRHDLAGHFEGWEKARVKLWELEMVDKYQDLYTASVFGPR